MPTTRNVRAIRTSGFGACVQCADSSAPAHDIETDPMSPRDVAKVLADGRLTICHLPIVDVASGLVVGTEGLARVRSDCRGLIGPAAFIPTAERSGQIRRVGSEVIDMGARDAAWLVANSRVASPMRVWVNLAAEQFVDPDDLVADVEQALERHGCAPSAFGVEVTESTLMANLDGAVEALTRLRDLGIATALDDFGTGHSSLEYLRRLPLDVVKIDRTFITGVGGSLADSAIVEAVIELAHVFGLVIVAEGVETVKQLASLIDLKADHVQGWLFARAVRREELLGMLGRTWAGRDLDVSSARHDYDWSESPRSRLLLSALDALPMSVVIRSERRIAYANPAFERETGWRPDQVLGQPPGLLEPDVDPGYRAAVDVTGRVYPLDEVTAPIQVASGDPHWIAIRRDVTREHMLARQVGRQQAAQEFASRFAQSCLSLPARAGLEHPDLLQNLVRDVGELLEAERTFLDLIDHSAGTVVPAAGWTRGVDHTPADGIQLGSVLPAARLPATLDALDRHTALVYNGGDEPIPQWLAETSVMFGHRPGPQVRVALKVNERVYGTLAVESSPGQRRDWLPDEIEFLVSVAASAAALDARSRSHELASSLVAAADLALSAPRGELGQRLDTLLARIALLHRCDGVYIDLIDPSKSGTPGFFTTFASGATIDVRVVLPELSLSITDPYFKRLARMEPMIVNDVYEPESAWFFEEHPTIGHPGFTPARACLFMPIAIEGELGGVVGLFVDGRPRRWIPDEIENVRGLARIIGSALESHRTLERLAESERRLHSQANTDEVTKLANRAAFQRKLDEVLDTGRAACLILVDLDGFKVVNDSFGHLAGDELLVLAGERLRAAVRTSGRRELDLVTRYGGDEFAIICVDADAESGQRLAQTMVDRLASPFVLSENVAQIGASAGVVEIRANPGHCLRPGEVVRTADMALYRAKREGKQRVCMAEPT